MPPTRDVAAGVGIASALAASIVAAPGWYAGRRVRTARERHGPLFDDVLAVLRRHDLIADYLSNSDLDGDAYAGQAASLLRDLPEHESSDGVADTLGMALCFGFGPAGLAVSDVALKRCADEVWALWRARDAAGEAPSGRGQVR